MTSSTSARALRDGAVPASRIPGSLIGRDHAVPAVSTRPSRRAVRTATAIGASVTLGLTALFGGGAAIAAPAACVGGSGCFASIQAAVDAAPAGSTVRIGSGSFHGGIVIAKPLTLAGAGESRTVITGGGPVVTVEPAGTPTVRFVDLTVTGGVSHGDGVYAQGGGIDAPSTGSGKGATVVLQRVRVSGNRTAPTSTIASPSGLECTSGTCRFAQSAGAGIATTGDLTLDHATVAGNVATGHASNAWGAGVYSDGGRLTIVSSTITGNRAEASAIGIYAEGGGVMVSAGSASIVGSVVTDNTARLATTWPVHTDTGGVLDQKALGGGLKFSAGVAATVTGSKIDGNRVSAIDPAGEPLAFASGIEDEGTLTLRSDSVSRNTTNAVVATSSDVGLSGDTIEIDHTASLRDVRIVGNQGAETSRAGSAEVATALSVISDPGEKTTASGLLISGNSSVARSASGPATAYGAGLLNNALLDLSRSRVEHNRAAAYGTTSTAQGGGIWNGVLLSGPPVTLELHHVTIDHNAVVAPEGRAQGGGIFSTVPFTADHVVDVANHPGNCFGKGC